MSSKPTLFLPLEIKARELNSKLLVAVYAIRAGFRVYIGTKDGIDSLVKKKKDKAGIYFYKDGNVKDKLYYVGKKCQRLVVLDEEMGMVIQNMEYHYSRRIDCEEFIDSYYVLGENHAVIVSKVKPKLADKIQVVGWPRIDFWRKEMRYFYDVEVADIKSRHPSFILFSSDFGFLSETRIADEVNVMLASGAKEHDIRRLEKVWRVSMDEYRIFIEFLKEWVGFDLPKLIIRPHPAEDHKQWQQDLAGMKNIQLAYEGEIGPWVIASEAVLHRGCTTGVQAYACGVQSMFLKLRDAHVSEQSLSFKVSHKVSSIEELKTVFLSRRNSVAVEPISYDFGDEIFMGDRLAAELIVDDFGKMAISSEIEVRVGLLWKTADMLKDSIYKFRSKYRIGMSEKRVARAQRKRPGGFKVDEISRIVQQIDPEIQYAFKQALTDVVMLERCESDSSAR